MPPPINFMAGLARLDGARLARRARRDAAGGADTHGAGRAEGKGRGQTPTRIAASPGETVEEWLINNGQTARIREMLWEPLALAALNQSVRVAAAPPFAAVLAQMFGGGPRDASLALPAWPLDQLYAEPARRFIEERGGEVRIGCPARMHLESGRVGCTSRRGASAVAAGSVVAAVPWYALADLFVGDTAPVEANSHGRRGDKAVADREREPVARPADSADAISGSAGPIDAVGVRQGADVRAGTSHLTLVSSGADDVMALQNDELISLALRELREALPEAQRRQGCARVGRQESGARHTRSPPASRSGPPTATDVKGLVLAGDWIETGLPATIEGAAISGRRAAEAICMNSVVVHYQEIALKGRNRPWFIARLVRNIKTATSRPRRAARRHEDGAHRDHRSARPMHGNRWPSGCAMCSASRIFRGPRSCRSTSTASRRPFSTISAICRFQRSACRRSAQTSDSR